MVRPCSRPASDRNWPRGSEDKEHAMSQQSNNSAIAVIDIDIGKNSFHVVGHDQGSNVSSGMHFIGGKRAGD
jgi:hypothetical protein